MEDSMAAELKLIAIYLAVSDACRDIVGDGRLRRRGFAPALTDAEAITMEIFAEMQGHHSDSAIWRYFDAHWRHFFPTLPTRSVFAKHCANLSMLKQMVQRVLYPAAADIHITDGFPISVCMNCRVSRRKIFKSEDEVSWGFCASKQEHYFGFHGHVVLRDEIVAFALTPANVDERLVVRNWFGLITGLLIGDKGFISKGLDEECDDHAIDLQTPLRRNMSDPRDKEAVRRLMRVRRRIETTIGQLAEFYRAEKPSARDLFHMVSRLARKILAYNMNLSFKES
jgi:Transposase DDE domain